MENIRPIKTEADYDWAIAEITKYFENEPEVGSLDGDRFDVLATLIEAYEDKHYPIQAPDPVEAIHSHMQLFNLSRKALAEVIGSSPRATEVLNRKRALTLDMIFKLNKEWNIPAEILVRPYHLAKDRGGKRA
ncbi:MULTISPECIES: type II toxin-antitoxin system HigA family antitoxin [unclassified Mesorhizobium]|uniref:helix-turn-helix domain-containing protein n=1 Tax=unclassified Mesorhizobium TaxID=325217 RepID=UPI0011282396|nr:MULTISPECIES: type II toxin-antitoxin system HigA family antitoxin [unclassified Mesorhizobium]MBZ9743429.1 type II toxin-antitoxin system HigA family antitoxin [Mesorhizobium sp. CO1-1-4]MBZ9805444.1 type II toxin-antitoxin system HigA family antitoxin [Mesorhizobium sp. ES1-6]TPL85989.1 type II toxin-antitoxin system HigA family antitoxin [Mesorhizobium sp. B2-3-12]